MSYTIKQLIEFMERPSKPVTVKLDDPIKDVLNMMIKFNYSQLPVIDVSEQLQGMVTSDSILQSLSNFGWAIDNLKVTNVYIKKNRKFCFNIEDDLLDLLECLRNYNAAIITAHNGSLISIVTSYDVARYFSQKAQDYILVMDFETTIKDYIRNAIPNDDSEAVLAFEVENNITEPMKNKFKEALKNYLKHYDIKLNSDWAEDAFSCIQKKGNTKGFDELTLNEYVVLLRNIIKKWHNGQLFGQDIKIVETSITPFVKKRNDVMHFRGEISQQQREQINHWLQQFQRHQINRVARKETVVTDKNVLEVNIPDEALVTEGSRYAPLALWLQNQSIKNERVTLTFKQIEERIIHSTLPSSARQHPSWWSNDSSYNTQSQWVEVGWRVANIRLNEEIVMFARMKDREKAYIEFFNALLSELSAASDIPWKIPTPDGQGWVHVIYFPEGKKQIPLAYSFTRDGRLRVELYIAIGNKAKNKQIFDKLHNHKNEIENKVGELLTWERMDEKDASRIALYHEGAITDKPEQLIKLRAWAVEAMAQFYNAIAKPVNDAIKMAG